MASLKFLVDENIGQSLVNYLVAQGFDAETVRGGGLIGRQDHELIDYAYKNGRVIITNDKDFGFLVYRQGLPAHGIILFRFSQEIPALKIMALATILQHKSARILGHLIVVSESGTRLRPLPKPPLSK